jgi:ribosomal protein S18 acetylase RimI-like enzyme
MLTGSQAHLAVASGDAVRIDPGYGPFAAARDGSPEAQAALAATLSHPDDSIFLVEPEPWPAPAGTRVVHTAPLLQMVAERPEPPRADDGPFTALGESDIAAMTELALSTEPGPWGPKTHRYAQFWGLRDGARLVAMAGERMRPGDGLAEVSAVCTAPDQRGRGLAGALIRHVMAQQVGRGELPFLHSFAANTGAIRLYETLGFRATRQMVVTVLARD